MYKWDGKQIRKDIAEMIMQKVIEVGELTTAIQILKREGKIKHEISDSTYIKRLYNLDSYKAWRKSKDEQIKAKNQQMIELRQKGYTIGQIAKIVGKSFTLVQNVCIKVKKDDVSVTVSSAKAKKIVDYWNSYSYPGQIMTKETKEAFKLLGLEIPKL